MDRWPSHSRFGSETSEVLLSFNRVGETHTCAHPMRNASTSLRRHCSTAHPSQASPSVSVHPRLAGDVLASVRASGFEREGSCHTTHATSLMVAASETGVPTKAGSLDGSVVRVSGSRTLQKVRTRGQWRALIVARYDKKQSSGSRPPHSLSPAPTQVGNTRAACRGVIDKTIPRPAVHKRITAKYVIDVFGGSGFLAKAANHVGLRGYVLDTEVISASAAIASLLHRARMPWNLEHPFDSWLWDVPKIEALAAQLRTALSDRGIVDLRAESELCFQLGMWTSGICTVVHEHVLGLVDMTTPALYSTNQFLYGSY